MPKLYLANCTRQNTRVMFRLDFNTQGELDPRAANQLPKHVDIPPGQQRVVAGELHMNQIDDIIRQLEPFGPVAEMDVKNMRHKIGTWVFNVNQPVKENTIRQVMAGNTDELTEQGRQRRVNAAMAVAGTLQNATDEAPKGFSVEYEQVPDDDTRGPLLAQGVKVDTAAPPPKGARMLTPRRTKG